MFPIDDHDVHAWTAVLDEYLSDGRSLATLAVGNDRQRTGRLLFSLSGVSRCPRIA